MSEVAVSPEITGYAAKRLVEAARREDACLPPLARCTFCTEIELVCANPQLLYQVLLLLSERLLTKLVADGHLGEGEHLFFHDPDDDPDDTSVLVATFVYLIQDTNYPDAEALFADMWDSDPDGDQPIQFACVLLRTAAMVPIEL